MFQTVLKFTKIPKFATKSQGFQYELKYFSFKSKKIKRSELSTLELYTVTVNKCPICVISKGTKGIS